MGTGPDMDTVLTVPSACSAHSMSLVLSMFVVAPAELNVVGTLTRGGSPGPDNLCEQSTHVDKGRG